MGHLHGQAGCHMFLGERCGRVMLQGCERILVACSLAAQVELPKQQVICSDPPKQSRITASFRKADEAIERERQPREQADGM